MRKQNKKYNKEIDGRLIGEELQIYFLINDKLTNHIPISGKDAGSGKTNGVVDKKDETRSSPNRFRMIFIPDEKTCVDSKYFDALINTRNKSFIRILDMNPIKRDYKRQ